MKRIFVTVRGYGEVYNGKTSENIAIIVNKIRKFRRAYDNTCSWRWLAAASGDSEGS